MRTQHYIYQNIGNFYLSSAKSVSDACNYSPFGVTLKGRNFKKTGSLEDFRFGFNGMEADDEMKGDGNSYDFGARMLDTRLGRWLSIDAYHEKYPHLSPYSFVNNSPLRFVDKNGDSIIIPEFLQKEHLMAYNSIIKTFGAGFKPVLIIGGKGELTFAKPSDMKRALRYIENHYDSKNEKDRMLATMYSDILSGAIVTPPNSVEEWKKESERLLGKRDKTIKSEFFKEQVKELEKYFRTKNPVPLPVEAPSTPSAPTSTPSVPSTAPAPTTTPVKTGAKVTPNAKKNKHKKSTSTGWDLDDKGGGKIKKK